MWSFDVRHVALSLSPRCEVRAHSICQTEKRWTLTEVARDSYQYDNQTALKDWFDEKAWLLMIFSFNTYPPFATVSLLAEVNCSDLKHKLDIGLSFTAFAEHFVHMFMSCSWSKISASKCTFSVHDIVLLIIHLAAAQTDDRLEISRALPSSLRFTRHPGLLKAALISTRSSLGWMYTFVSWLDFSLHEQPPIILRFLFLVLKISKQFFLRARRKAKKKKDPKRVMRTLQLRSPLDDLDWKFFFSHNVQ